MQRRHDYARYGSLYRALAPLGAAPAKCSDYVSAVTRQAPGGWGMYLNNQVGDCVPAAACHGVMLRTANAGKIVIPTDTQCLAAYETVGGYVPGDPETDTGCDEGAMCEYMIATGIAGQKDTATAPIDPTNIEHVKWSVQLFGSAMLGIIVDERMEDEFANGQPWETPADPRDPNAGGHGVPFVSYDASYAYVVTWGGLQAVAWPLVASANFLEEAHGSVAVDFLRAGGTAPSGFDLQTLLADLGALGMAQAA